MTMTFLAVVALGRVGWAVSLASIVKVEHSDEPRVQMQLSKEHDFDSDAALLFFDQTKKAKLFVTRSSLLNQRVVRVAAGESETRAFASEVPWT